MGTNKSKTEFPQNYIFAESESKWQKFWREKKLYEFDKNESRENSFVIDTPPPTVSGQLHVGHVYSYTHTDFIARYNRMRGKNIFYPMCFDDNGLPTERLVEKQKQIRAMNVDRSEFVKICQEVVEIEEEKFRKLFDEIALSVDWNLKYQTISPLSRTISQMSFLDLVDKNEVYRDNQPVLWDVVDQTALSQADIEDKEEDSFMNDVIFRTESGEPITIATTRPELLPACVAIFYNPDDTRYQRLKGQFAITPLFNVKVPILPDQLQKVQQNKGTGLVMCCTFGDITDLLWWRMYKLPLKTLIDKRGIFLDMSFDETCQNLELAQNFAKQLVGLKIKDAREKIIEILKSENLISNQIAINHIVKCAERSGSPLEIIETPQWFVNTIKHKEALKYKANQINWHPSYMKIRLDNWIDSIAWDWCISRQRYFGVPFPVWYSKRAGEEGKPIFATKDQLPVDPLHDLPKGYESHEVEPDTDVMDTWATSSVSPQLNSHAISEKYAINFNRHKKLFPVDLRTQGHEIIRTWSFYTILKSYLHENTIPWKNIMLSGWCLAEDRSKMSKSKDNVLSPENLLQKYGADALRYWAASSKLGADTAYSENVLKNGKRLLNKLWNASKFISIHFHKLEEQDKIANISQVLAKISHPLDQWLLLRLQDVALKVEHEMSEYEYASSMSAIEQFFWSIFCDNYLEISKVRAYSEDNSDDTGTYSAILTLYHSMRVILHLFAPFVPHITEEIYQILYANNEKVSIHQRDKAFEARNMEFTKNDEECEKLIQILDLIKKSKAEKNLSIKAPIKLLEISGVKLNVDLATDLKNVTASENLLFVEEFSHDYTRLSDGLLKLNILY